MRKIIYSAPAKVILSGEHAVVYGKPALVSAVDLRLSFAVYHLDIDVCLDGNIEYIANLIRNFLGKKKTLITRNSNYQYRIDSDIPIGRGLGSSAALSVAGVAAFLEFFSGQQFKKETINNLAYQAEKKFHQNPSGVDNTSSCFGGLLYYRKEFEFLKNVSVLNFKIPKKIEEKLYLIDSGKPAETTSQMISLVGSLYNKKPRLVEEILAKIEKTTKGLVMAIVQEDEDFFQKAIFTNNELLEKLGVVSSKTRQLLRSLNRFGVGKTTGAGGKKKSSGFLLFYCNKINEFKRYCQLNRISYFKFKQSSTGLIKLN
jgi:mevalonate kinase